MKFCTKEIGFMSEENLGSFNLAKVEALGGNFVGCSHDGVYVWAHTIAEGLGGLDDVVESVFFFRLKW